MALNTDYDIRIYAILFFILFRFRVATKSWLNQCVRNNFIEATILQANLALVRIPMISTLTCNYS